MKQTILALVAGLALAGPAMAASVGSYTSFYTLGDSLSDPGKGVAPDVFPFVGGRFSNGPVWAETVTEDFAAAGLPNANLAIGGATAGGADMGAAAGFNRLFTLSGQVGSLGDAVRGGVTAPGDDPLVSFWFGANDIFNEFRRQLPSGNVDLAAFGLVAIDAADAIAAGARSVAAIAPAFDSFVFFNLPDLGQVPLFNGTALSGFASLVTDTFNARLADNAAALRGEGFEVLEIDVAGLQARAVADPAAFGFTNVTASCRAQAELCVNAPNGADSFLFADDVHPTAPAHAQIASLVSDAIATDAAPIPLPASGVLLLAGLGGLGAMARRRRAA